jgi:hypothetical protein
VVGSVSGEGAADRIPHFAAGAIGADHVLCPDGALFPFVGAGGVQQRDGDGVFPLVGDLEALELKALIRLHARG